MLANVSGLGGAIGERNGTAKGFARLGGARELLQQRALHAMEIEVALQPLAEQIQGLLG